MPNRKRLTKQQLADEAWRRAQEELQLIERPGRPTNYLTVVGPAPATCPACGHTAGSGFAWSICFGDLLQCHQCAQLVEVSRAEFEAYGRRLHEHYARLNPPKVRTHGRRSRGAG